jgi:predicted NAD/FAD-binding protein
VRIAVIGGGAAGLATAWLLQEDHEVTLLEKEDRLGGHANTVEVEIDGSAVPVESGFEFFMEEGYPCFVRLLRALELPLLRYPMKFTLFSPGSDRVHLLPPVRSGRMQWSALQPRSLSYLLQFAFVLQSAARLAENRDCSVTIGDFVQRCRISKAFRDRFLLPFLDGGWCAGQSVGDRCRCPACPGR